MAFSLNGLLFQGIVGEQGEPVQLFEQSAALKLAVVDREAVGSLTDEWDQPGVYVLLDRPDPEGVFGAYVGKAPAGIRARLKIHLSKKDHWYRAVLIQRDTTHGFNSAHTAWLEGRIYDLLDSADLVRLHNAQRPGDDTVAEYELPMLEAAVEPVARLMRLIGHETATLEEGQLPRVRGAKRQHGVSVADLISAGLIAPGEDLISLVSTYPGSARVLLDGQVEYNGTRYATPSAAAAALRGGPANGWWVWSVVRPNGKVRLATLRTRFQETQG